LEVTFKCDFCGKDYRISDGRYDITYGGPNSKRYPFSKIMCPECYDKYMFKDEPHDYPSYTPSFKDLDEDVVEDSISRPSHYCKGREYEPKDVIRDWELNFNLGNVVKYVSRAGRKGDALEDLEKAKQYLEFEIEAMEKGDKRK
jgi:hypothetical protein